MDSLIGTLLQYGTTPALVVLAALVGILLKKLDENAKRDETRAVELRTFVTTQLSELEERIDQHLVTADKRIDELSARVSVVERDYLPRDEHYRDFSGWRAEIARLGDLIINLFKEKK